MTKELKPEKFLRSYPAQSVVLVCTSYGKVNNVAPFAWHMPISIEPPAMVIGVRRSRDTYSNILDNKEFVVAIPGPELVDAIDRSAISFPREKSEFHESGLTPLPGNKIDTPGVKECQVNMECKLMWNKQAGDHDVMAGEIVSVILGDDLDPETVDRSKLEPVYHTAVSGAEYSGKGEPI
jgi:flavin reductase (DIM6/NTAB) family NADH-FMN oxidoreductase RutF